MSKQQPRRGRPATTDGLTRDPRYKNIYWRKAKKDRTTVVFLGPKGAEALKRLRDERRRQSN